MGVRDGKKVVQEVQLDGRVWKKKKERMYRKEKRRKRWKKGGM